MNRPRQRIYRCTLILLFATHRRFYIFVHDSSFIVSLHSHKHCTATPAAAPQIVFSPPLPDFGLIHGSKAEPAITPAPQPRSIAAYSASPEYKNALAVAVTQS